jgi:hypothetical protein
MNRWDAAPAALGVSFILLGFLLSYFAYLLEPMSPNPEALLGALLFWSAASLLLFAFPLRKAGKIFSGYVQTPLGGTVFSLYLVTHLLLYGFLLEVIFSTIYGAPSPSPSPTVFLATNVFTPPSIASALLGLAYNPTITFILTPITNASLSLYSITFSIVIDILLVANICETRRLGKLCTKGKAASSYIVLPTLGLVLGASCCLSVPLLILFSLPSAAVLTSSVWLYYFSYFFFPPFAVALLTLNLCTTETISKNATSPDKKMTRAPPT